MSQSQTKLEELPFSFQGVEEKYGSLIDAEELCPGVYYASARLLERYTFLVAQYMVVTASSPAISPEARAYGAPPARRRPDLRGQRLLRQGPARRPV